MGRPKGRGGGREYTERESKKKGTAPKPFSMTCFSAAVIGKEREEKVRGDRKYAVPFRLRAGNKKVIRAAPSPDRVRQRRPGGLHRTTESREVFLGSLWLTHRRYGGRGKRGREQEKDSEGKGRQSDKIINVPPPLSPATSSHRTCTVQTFLSDEKKMVKSEYRTWEHKRTFLKRARSWEVIPIPLTELFFSSFSWKTLSISSSTLLFH